jgi:hypothetical protein
MSANINDSGIGQKISDVGSNVANTVSDTFASATNTLSSATANASSSINSALSNIGVPAGPGAPAPPAPNVDATTSALSGSPFANFSLSKYTDASTEFLESNSLVAKLSFLLLVVFVFFVLLKLLTALMSYFLNKSNFNPTKLIDGMVNANQAFEFKQSPSDATSKTIYRSDNKITGIEFTWSTYLFIRDLEPSSTHGNLYHVFHKGNNSIDKGSGLNSPNNSPGLYINRSENSLNVIMNTFTVSETITVPNIPRNKWINVIIRCQNRKIDVYINGLIAQSYELTSVPKQNYGNVYVGQNDGFPGYISNLWYYNYALTIGEIQRLNYSGPSVKSANISGSFDKKTDPDYLSLRWYFGGAGDQYIS